MIEGVIFDVDGTLYDYAANDKIAVKCLCEFAEKNLNISEKNFLDAYKEARRIVKEERLTDGGARHSRVLFLQTTLELLKINPFCYVLKMYNVYWNNFLENVKPFDGLIEFIKILRDKNIKIAVCTDMTAHIQYRKIERLGLKNFIDCMISSEETGLEKPSPSMFELALKKLNVSASEAIYFGDSLERDIKGAANVGIKPIWYTPSCPNCEERFDCIKIKSYNEILNKNIF